MKRSIVLASLTLLGCHGAGVATAEKRAYAEQWRAVLERARPYAGCYSFRVGPWQTVSSGFSDTTGMYAPAFKPPEHIRLALEDRIGYFHLEPQPDSTSEYYRQAGWLHVRSDSAAPGTLMLIWLSDTRRLFAPTMSVYLTGDSTGYRGQLRVNTDATSSQTPYREARMAREECRAE